jgi:hypothetical protein
MGRKTRCPRTVSRSIVKHGGWDVTHFGDNGSALQEKKLRKIFGREKIGREI